MHTLVGCICINFLLQMIPENCHEGYVPSEYETEESLNIYSVYIYISTVAIAGLLGFIFRRVIKRYLLTYFKTVYSWAFVRHMARIFSEVWQSYFVIEMQIITGFDHICWIQNTEKSKYNEYTKCIWNIKFSWSGWQSVCYNSLSTTLWKFTTSLCLDLQHY